MKSQNDLRNHIKHLNRCRLIAPMWHGNEQTFSICLEQGLDARLSKKRATYWVGYKAHLTETCDEDLPILFTNVETTLATTQDFDVVNDIHSALKVRELLPNEHLMDMGFIAVQTLVEAQ